MSVLQITSHCAVHSESLPEELEMNVRRKTSSALSSQKHTLWQYE